tara:strand:+ start:2683 stop:3168 length:486 start_codon:yes stop_codon:yes gene_type:complete
MATINATLNVNSSDLSGNSLSLSKTMMMRKHTTSSSTTDGLEFTSGLIRRTFTSTNHVDLITSGAQNYGTPTASDSNAANKIYIKNTGSSSTEYFEVGLGTSSGSGTATSDAIGGTHLAIGKLYGGDWLLIPGHLKATVGDVTVKPSTAEKMSIEFMVFFE